MPRLLLYNAGEAYCSGFIKDLDCSPSSETLGPPGVMVVGLELGVVVGFDGTFIVEDGCVVVDVDVDDGLTVADDV